MKNNKTLRLAQTECGAAATFPAHQGRALSRQKSPRRSPTRASCAALVNALFWKILVTRVNSFLWQANLLSCAEAQRSASATSDALQTPISGLPEIGAQMCASRASPTCVDRYAPVSR